MTLEPVLRSAAPATAAEPVTSPTDPLSTRQNRLFDRTVAFVQVVDCSGFPTQLLLIYAFAAAGFQPFIDGAISLGYVAALSLSDAALLIGLILLFLRTEGEAPRDVFLGRRPNRREDDRPY